MGYFLDIFSYCNFSFQGTRKVITTSLLNATDPDSPRDKLVYAVVGDGNGRIEKINQPGVSLNTFTQIEIDQGSIVYFHNSSITGNTKLIFQVSDGIVTSQSAYLRVNVTPLVLRLLNNTGALLTLHSYILITPANLTFTTNSDDPSLQIVYKIVGSCEFGVVERGTDLGGNVTWQIVKEFTSTHLSQELVRYRHTNGKPVQDMFKFKVSVQDIESSLVYDFRLTFAELKLESIHMTHLRLNGIVQIFISADNLMYATTPISVNPVKITYTLIKLPLFGNLFKNFDETRILYGYNFTQGDINMGKIKYKMLRTTYVPVEDEISFQVSTDHCDFESVVTLKFFYTPPKNLPHRLKTTLKSVKVKEGGTVPILITELNVQVVSVKSIDYQIVSGPNHGMLTLLDPIQNSTESNITNFTPSQIAAGRLIYTHDGTETTSDFIQFLALSSVEDDFMTVGILNMSVTLVNDNVPVRTVAKVFRIVSGGQRLLTTRHIKFKDDDMDFRANDLIYTVKNGSGIFSSGTKIPLKQFTQGDLEAGKVLVIENGQGGTQILLSVSDGIHTTECILDIRPSPPYIEITNNSHLVVSQGGQATITNANLFSDTNVNIKPQDIRYDILSGPNQGEILMSSQPGLTAFTQGDVESGLVIYKHLSTGLAQDRIQLKVTVENIFAEGWLAVRVFPAAYWEPLVVITNQTLYVEESTSVSLTGQFLQVKQAGVPPSDITFLVLTGPEGGYLEVEGSEEERAGEDDDKGGIRAFDQATVDAGKLYYVQVSANQTHDRIIVDVTNGISWLRSLIIKLIVVPSKIYLAGQELKVDEGGFVIFPHNAFASISPFYINKITDYFILENPVYGSVVIGPNNKSVSKWTAHQLKSSLIKYVHDGSETLNDTFTIIGRAGDKESVPVAVKVQILPVNDMIPKVVNRTEVSIWRGGSHLITSEHLAAVDRDTPPENLTFAIVSAVGGYVALITNKSASIDRFTQEQINNEDVLLVHNGKERAEFEAVVVDGVNKFGPITLSSRIIELSLNLSSNVGLHIFPLLRKPIGKQLLYGYCSDPSREVYYKITSQPMKGKLFVNSFSTIHNNEQPVFNFTQSDINDLRVWYQHTMPFSEAAANDSFMFDLMADYVQPLRDNVFHIDISVLSGGLDQLLDVSSFSIHVEEGGVGIVHLNTSGILEFLSINVGIEKPIIHGSITLLPQHGNVCFIEDCNTTIFTIVQLQSGNIVYQHDHSDTLEDLMQISLYLDPGDVLLCNITFLIKINPVNDQEFKLITESPHITVVQGQEVVITDQDLYTEDLDSAASDIIYDIIDGPNLGNIMIGNETIQKFTQSDINNRKVRYKHKGLLQPTSFYFRVSDGKFNPAYTVFNIAVIQIILNVSVVLPVSLQQGSNVVHISDKILHLRTNANEETILYNVSTLPRHGIVYVYDVPTLQFTHKQLMNKKVMYMQTDMTTPSDTFELVAHAGLEDGPIVSGLWVNVSVEPLIIYGEFSPLSGTKTRLDTSAIDATPLAKLTNSNPVYKILKRPKYGRLRKIIHSSGERKFTREKDVSKFSHEELQNGVIYYVSRRTLETVEDRFPFLLSASIFQPAIGEIRFEVIGESPSTTFRPPKPRIPDPQSPVGRNGVEMASPNMSDDYLLGVTMVTGVIALALLIVGFVRCGTKHTEEENSLKPDLPDPLPQPPDDLLPSSPRLAKRNTPVLTPVALPQCKIPGDSITSSEPDLNLRYPYGDEDWSSYDTTDIAFQSKNSNNPMLRKNQYWV
ncbi:hypothetical protein AAG570_012622 [Ranatra chinensis]|uniref:Chondroitin sulfate proteoglycan 4 n=1 Tax=Ranatra chinensis TaxID=642074 RepID=A0ABD0YEI5_9HEMI